MIAKIILASLIATAIMTLFTNVVALLVRRNLFVVRILTQQLEKKSEARTQKNFFPYWVLAVILHYLIGVIFGFGCLSWIPRILNFDVEFRDWLITGLIIGMIAVPAWMTFKHLRGDNTTDVPWPLFYISIFLGHILFALILFLVYFKFR